MTDSRTKLNLAMLSVQEAARATDERFIHLVENNYDLADVAELRNAAYKLQVMSVRLKHACNRIEWGR